VSELANLSRRDSCEVDPPADWLENRGTKFYVRSGSYSVILASDVGPIYAAYLFAGRAIAGGMLHALGDTIEVSESGSFGDDDLILRRETNRFLRNKFGIGEQLLTDLVANELNPGYED
jgi:hypothetical protein